MTTRRLQRDTSLYRFGLVGGFLALIAALVLARRGAATGYELSLYSATPLGVWVGIAVALFISLVIAFRARPGIQRGVALLLGGGAALTVVALPVLRGYYFYGTADPMTHLGWTKDIASGAMSPSELLYPGVHMLALGLRTTFGYPIRTALLVAVLCLTALFFVFVPLTVSRISSRESALVVGAFSTFLLAPVNNISVSMHTHPFSQTLLFSAVAAYLLYMYLFAGETASSGRALSISLAIVLLATVFFHPQLAVHLLAALFGISMVQFIRRRRVSAGTADDTHSQRQSHRSVYGHTVVLAIGIVGWAAGRPAFESQLSSIARAIQGYLTGNPPSAGGRIASQGASLTAIGGSLTELYLKLFLVTTVLAITGGVLVIASLAGRFEDRPTFDSAVKYLTVSGLATGPLFVLYLAGNISEMHFRTLGFVALIAVLLGALALTESHWRLSKRFDSDAATIVVVVLFGIMLPMGLATAYQSPYIYKANQHVAESHMTGFESVLDYTPGAAGLASIRGGAGRYSDGIRGVDGTPEYDRSISGENLTRLKSLGSGPLSVAVSTYDIEREVRAYDELRYSRSQFESLDQQPGVARVLSNGNVRLYHVQAATGTESPP